MTEPAASGPPLGRVLARIALRWNTRAQQRFADLLPEPESEELAEWLRRGHDLEADAPTALEERLQRSLAAAEPAPDADSQDDGVGTQADEVEAFFSAGEAADPESPAGLPATRLAETVLARLLQTVPPQAAAALLAELPVGLQGQAIVLLATSTPMSAARELPGDERELFDRLQRRLASQAEQWGVEPACAILRGLSTTRRLRRALTAVADIDDEAATIIQNHLFEFDDLLRLRDVELQALLGRIDNPTLARALTGVGDTVMERVYANASDRRAALLRDEAELYAEITREEVERARAEVLATVRYLYERGGITTYFGSISRVGGPSVEEEQEEDEELEDPGESASEPEVRPIPTPESGRQPLWTRVLLGGLVAVAVLLLVTGLTQLLSTSRAPTAGSPAASRRQGGSGSGRVLVLGEEDADAGAQDAEAADTREEGAAARSLGAGQTLRVPAGVQAVLRFPVPVGSGTAARVQAASGAEVEGTAAGELAEPGEATGLFLRAGRVTVTVLDEGFVVRTPVVHVSGAPGARFRVRVVLDATTTVEALQGTVAARSPQGSNLARLQPGQRLRVDGRGGTELSP